MLQYLLTLDRELFIILNSYHNSFLDIIMWHISGTLIWIPLYIYILYLIYKTKKSNLVIGILFLILSVALSNTISSELIKPIFHRLRPSYVPQLADIIHIVKGYTGGKFGFASSHAANSMAIAAVAMYFIHKLTFRISIMVWVIVVSYSRIYLGVHYPADIIGGLIIGLCSSLLIMYMYRKTQHLFVINKKRIN